jgi:hypothetical protein
MASQQEVKVSEEEILEAERKERPLLLDPIIVASFGDFHAAFLKYLSCSYKGVGCTGQSTRPNGPDGMKNETSSGNR